MTAYLWASALAWGVFFLACVWNRASDDDAIGPPSVASFYLVATGAMAFFAVYLLMKGAS